MARILIVDDNPDNRFLIVTLLSHDGHTVVEAANGEEGLQRAREHFPSLIIADLYLPGMPGVEFIKALRSEPNLANTAVALYTGTTVDGAMREFMALYRIEHVIPKPAEPADILAAVRSALPTECK